MTSKLKSARFLIEKGAKIDLKAKDKWTAMYYACFHGDEKIVQLLLKKGVEVD